MENKIINFLLSFILGFYGNPAFPRNIVQIVIDYVRNLIAIVILPSLLTDIRSVLERDNVANSTILKIEEYFKKYSSVFDNVSTECK